MIHRADVVVVGGGLIGCAVARELARRAPRSRIVVVERGEVGAEASRAAIAEESGLDVEFRTAGIVYVARSAARARGLAFTASKQALHDMVADTVVVRHPGP